MRRGARGKLGVDSEWDCTTGSRLQQAYCNTPRTKPSAYEEALAALHWLASILAKVRRAPRTSSPWLGLPPSGRAAAEIRGLPRHWAPVLPFDDLEKHGERHFRHSTG